MENFDYYNPTKIVFGKDQIARLSELVSSQKILLLYGGGSIKKNTVYEQVLKALAGKTIFEVSGVQPNPTYEKAMEAVTLIRQEKIDFILAVGGGSVVDSAKFISLAVNYAGDPWEILTKQDLVHKSAVPFGAVLTLPATGSEMNCFFVISRGEDKLSAGDELVYPKFSILDPSVTLTLDTRQVGNGVVDAFVHVMEQYLTYPVNAPLQDRFAESVLKTLMEEGKKTYQKPQDYESRANLMWCAAMALSGVFGKGVPHDWSTHMIGHELTALYGIDHARTLATVFPAMMWSMKDQKQKKIIQYGERVLGLKGSDEEIVRAAIRKTVEFFESVGVATKLSAYQVKQDAIEAVVNRLSSRGFQPMGEKSTVDLNKVREVLRFALQ